MSIKLYSTISLNMMSPSAIAFITIVGAWLFLGLVVSSGWNGMFELHLSINRIGSLELITRNTAEYDDSET